MRRVRLIFRISVIFIFLAALFFWIHTRTTPDYIAISMDCRGPKVPQISYAGRQSFGLYAARGRIGLLYHSDVCDMVDQENLALFPAEPTRFLHDHSDNPDNHGFMGGISVNDLGYFVSFSHLGLSFYDGEDAATGHWETLGGFLVNSWVVLLAAALFFGFTNRRKLLKPDPRLCSRCGYDIRTQLLGNAGDKCPECGSPITAASNATKTWRRRHSAQRII